MKARWCFSLASACLLVIVSAAAQEAGKPATPNQPANPAADTPSTPTPTPAPVREPLTTQLRKSVAYIETHCLKFPNPDELTKMVPAQRSVWEMPQVLKWTQPDKLSQRSPQDLGNLPQESHSGTGFLVVVPDERLGKEMGFGYLVTNRHVMQPGIEHGNPCTVLFHFVFLNHKGATEKDSVAMQSVAFSATHHWIVPEDGGVDLALLPFAPNPTEWDFISLTPDMFATSQDISNRDVVEGDPVLFAGLFIQYAGHTKLEPIIRSGAIAMLPTDKIIGTLDRPADVYLAETHAFGGNSGSPMLVDVAKFKGGFGYNYKLLGVVAGTVNETSDFKLQVSTTYDATITANSGVSIVVPVEELKKLLFSPAAQQLRDEEVARKTQKKP